MTSTDLPECEYDEDDRPPPWGEWQPEALEQREHDNADTEVSSPLPWLIFFCELHKTLTTLARFHSETLDTRRAQYFGEVPMSIFITSRRICSGLPRYSARGCRSQNPHRGLHDSMLVGNNAAARD